MNIQRANMYAGAIIGSLLFFLLVNFFADLIYFGPEEAGEEEEVLAYAVETEEAEGGGEGAGEEAAGPDWSALLAAVDAAQGEKLFAKCKSCHSLEPGVNKVGPSLAGVVGRPIASVEGFSYSPALREMAGERWTLENLAAFLMDPKGFAPGTKMSFKGFKKPEEAVAMVVYLNEAGGNPVPLGPEKKAEAPAPEPAEETAAVEAPAAGETAEAPAQAPAAPAAEPAEAGKQAGSEAAAATEGGGDLLAGADLARGEKVFKKCKSCHSLEPGKNKLGPTLYGLVGRPVASVEGYSYSAAMKEKGGTWTVEALDAFLAKPKEFVPGTKMSFSGLRKPEDRAAVIAYIKAQGG